jgi:cysteine desulfurase
MALNSKNFDCIFTLKTEHDSVLNPVKNLKHAFIKIDANGLLDLADLQAQIKQLNSTNFLCSIMLANNESGVIQDIKKISKIVHENGGILHCDGTQFIGKRKFDFKQSV